MDTLTLLASLIGAIAALVGIAVGVTQILEYREKRKELKRDYTPQALPAQLNPVISPAASPPVAASTEVAKARTNNLPHQLTSFIGREIEINEVRHLLSNARLLTLVGSGGVGKTRLALHVATDELPAFPDGVWFVELAPLTDPSLVSNTIASVARVPEEPNRPMLLTLSDYFRVKTVLIVLDNCEHVLMECAQLSGHLLHAAPHLKIIATSREALGIDGEQAYRVPSLTLPDEKMSLDALSNVESVRLFEARAHAARSDFVLTANNGNAVAQICRRLDGVPLAIELAAARVKVLSPEQIATRLDDRFRLLTGGSRSALPRQQTLRAVIDWSHNLLSEPERVMLRRLAVFAGGWTYDAAEAVCADERLTRGEILDLLTLLIDKSLVIREEQDGEVRYRMLETVRHYSREKLYEAGEADAARTRHLDYFLRVGEAIVPLLHGPEQMRWAERLDMDNGNLRAALAWGHGAGRVEKGLRLVAALTWFWELRGYFREGREHAESLLAQPKAMAPTLLRAGALFAVTWMTVGMRDNIATRRNAEELIAITRQYPQDSVMMRAVGLNHLADVIDEDDPERAHVLRKESEALAPELGDPWTKAWLLHRKVYWLLNEQNYAAAHAAADESFRLFQSLGDQRYAAQILFSLGEAFFREGDIGAARSHFERCLSIARAAGHRETLMGALNDLGEVARFEGKTEEAMRYYQDALAMARELGIDGALQMWNQGVMLLHTGDFPKGKALLSEALTLHRAKGRKVLVVMVLDSFATAAAMQAQPQRAARLFGAVEQLRRSSGASAAKYESQADVAEHESGVAMARAQLDEANFSAAWAEGRTLSLEHAIELALRDDP